MIKIKVSVSYLASNYSKEKTIKLIEESSADYIHVDLMDGGFVPHKNFDLDEVLKLLSNHVKPLDIHLMTFDPIVYIEKLATLNPTYITFHLESTKDIVSTIELIKRNNIKVGISIKPSTDILELMPYISLIDLILIMSVEPGAGGQKFLISSVDRFEKLKKIRENDNLNFEIALDGGINQDTIKLLKNVDIVISGSYICKSTNYDERIKSLKY